MMRKLTIVTLSTFIVACGGGGDGGTPSPGDPQNTVTALCTTANEPVVGCWVSEVCIDLTTSPTETLSRNMGLLFHADGTMSQHALFYDNATCQGDPIANTDPLWPESYEFLGDKTMESGVTARVVDYKQQQTTFVQHTYGVIHIDNDRMCFGEGDFNAAVGGFRPSSNTISGAPGRLDFVNCAIRQM